MISSNAAAQTSIAASEPCLSPQLFDEAAANIQHMLQQDSFPRWKSSKEFSDLVALRRHQVLGGGGGGDCGGSCGAAGPELAMLLCLFVHRLRAI